MRIPGVRTPDTPLVLIEWVDPGGYDDQTLLTISSSTRAWSESQAEALLDRLDERAAAAGKPFTVSATHPETGLTLAITVGAPRSLVTFHDGGERAWAAAGSPFEAPAESQAFVFYFAGDYGEAAWQDTVTADEARQAFREFFRTGQRPASLDWALDF
jgi:hypothetical protein